MRGDNNAIGAPTRLTRDRAPDRRDEPAEKLKLLPLVGASSPVDVLMKMGSPSSLFQDTLGGGRPVALQLRVALSPSATARSALVSPP